LDFSGCSSECETGINICSFPYVNWKIEFCINNIVSKCFFLHCWLLITFGQV
jgi:hypothetical protein